jgi:hypothetical protein
MPIQPPPKNPTNRELKEEMDGLRQDVAELTESTKELVEAWKAAGKLVAFIKWLAGLSTAMGVLWIVVAKLIDGR